MSHLFILVAIQPAHNAFVHLNDDLVASSLLFGLTEDINVPTRLVWRILACITCDK